MNLATWGASCLRVLVLGLALSAPSVAATPVPAADVELIDRIIVKYRSPSAGELGRHAQLRPAGLAAQRFGLRLSYLRTMALGAQLLQVDRPLSTKEAERLAADIVASDPDVEYAEPDRMVQPTLSPMDPLYEDQWHYFEPVGGINLPTAWDKSTGSGVVVAVVDTGFRPHADLTWNLLQGYDFIFDVRTSNDRDGRDADARDPGDWTVDHQCRIGRAGRDSSWHGTHVAGTIAARTNVPFVIGGAGVAFDARVLPVRALGRCGGTDSDIADAIVWASGGAVNGVPANPTPAQVINLSLGSEVPRPCNPVYQTAIDFARARGSVVVAGAGNQKGAAADYPPGSCNGVITVAATDRNAARAGYSNFGAAVELAAPGGTGGRGSVNAVLSTHNSGVTVPGADSYEFLDGTSMATPHVSGVAALMLSANPALTPDEVAAILQRTARRLPATCVGCGSGILDANLAVEAARGNTCLYQDQEIVAIQGSVWHGVDAPSGLRTSLPCVDWSGAEAMAFTDGNIYTVQGGELWKTNVVSGSTSSLGAGWSGSGVMAAAGGMVYTVQGDTLWRTAGIDGTSISLGRRWTGTEALAAGMMWGFSNVLGLPGFRRYVYGIQGGVIWKVDGESGVFAPLATGWGGTEAMTFGDGFLYLVWGDRLWKMNATSGSYSLVEAYGWSGTEAMTYRDGFVYAVQGGQLWRTDPNGGSVSLGGGWEGTHLMTSVQ